MNILYAIPLLNYNFVIELFSFSRELLYNFYKKMKIKHSIVIVGSGPIGLSAALLFAHHGIDVGIILNKKKLDSDGAGPARLFAIAHNSCELLKNIVDLSNISQAINHIRIVDNNSYAKVDFAPLDIGLNSFGCMIDESILIKLLYSKLVNSNISIYEGAEDIEISAGEFFSDIKSSKATIQTPLIIAADGKYSSIRQKLAVQTKEYDYNQTAIVIDIRHSNWPHNGVAVEKFTPNGPFAILPKYEENGTTSSLVWIEKGKFTNLQWLTKDELKSLILRKLDGYLGDIELISEPMIYSLKLVQSSTRFHGRVVFIGDAAQGIHPIAGQGFNLGLRDINELIKIISSYREIGLDHGSHELLNTYSKLREVDVAKMITSTTLINSLFANDILPLKIIRRVGLNLFDKIPSFKRIIMKYASGL
jgi:2-octaprenyl-6-methoxyphenol hydroxylase